MRFTRGPLALALAVVIGLIAIAAASQVLAASQRGPGPVRSQPSPPFVIAVIGDYGECASSPCVHERAVAALVHSWRPNVILTVGDNSYDNGALSEVAVDQQPYAVDVAAGSFYPVTGNHDWGTGSLQPSLTYFHRPAHYVAHLDGGLIDFFATDMNKEDPDGDGSASVQAIRFRQNLATSRAVWKIVGSHQPFYSSGHHGTQPYTHWAVLPAVDLFLSGHDHDFEDLLVDGRHFVVDGVGGSTESRFMCAAGCLPQSVFHDVAAFGAVRLTVTKSTLTVEFIAVDGSVEHAFSLQKAESGP